MRATARHTLRNLMPAPRHPHDTSVAPEDIQEPESGPVVLPAQRRMVTLPAWLAPSRCS
jgi:hypothetical protein